MKTVVGCIGVLAMLILAALLAGFLLGIVVSVIDLITNRW